MPPTDLVWGPAGRLVLETLLLLAGCIRLAYRLALAVLLDDVYGSLLALHRSKNGTSPKFTPQTCSWTLCLVSLDSTMSYSTGGWAGGGTAGWGIQF